MMTEFRTPLLATILTLALTVVGCDAPEEGSGAADRDPDDTARHAVDGPDSTARADQTSGDPRILTFELADSLFADRERMAEIFGEENLDSGEVHVGEGEMLPATVLYPNDPRRRLKVAWHNAAEKSVPERIVIEDEPSAWSVYPGLSTGTTLDSLEKLNGRPFELLGFDWDYAGTVVNWSEGRLDSLESETRWLVVRLRPSDEDRARVGEEGMARVMGDGMFGSDHRAMREVNPRVYQILMIFAGYDPPGYPPGHSPSQSSSRRDGSGGTSVGPGAP